MPLLLPKNRFGRGMLRLSRTMLEKRGQNFARTKILPKETDISRGEKA